MEHLEHHLHALGARRAKADDGPFLYALYASTRTDLLGDGSADPTFAAQLIAMQQRLQAADYAARFPGADVLLLELAGAPFARLVVDTDADRVRLVDIALLPSVRRQGHGTLILRSLQQWAARKAVPLRLAVHHGNHGARRLYQTLGFDSVAADGAADELVWRPF